MPILGDINNNQSYDVKATAFPYTMVDVADLTNPESMINQAHLSGKKEGAGILGSDYIFYIATGSAPEDEWVSGGGADGADGADGDDGADGAEGPQGEEGPKGPAGADGADGFPTETQWNDLIARVEALEGA